MCSASDLAYSLEGRMWSVSAGRMPEGTRRGEASRGGGPPEEAGSILRTAEA